jgi:hypothetical protein
MVECISSVTGIDAENDRIRIVSESLAIYLNKKFIQINTRQQEERAPPREATK